MKKFNKILLFVLCFLLFCSVLVFSNKINAMTERYRFSYIPISELIVNTENLDSSDNIVDNVSVVFGFTYGLIGDNYPTIASNNIFGSITKIELIKNNNDLLLIYYNENENRSVIVWRGNASAYNFNLINNSFQLGLLGVWEDFNYNDLYFDNTVLPYNNYFIINDIVEYYDNVDWFTSAIVNYSSYNTFNTKYKRTLSVDFSSLTLLYDNYGGSVFYLDFIYNNLNYNQLSIHKGLGGYVYFNFSYYLNGVFIREDNATIYNPTNPNYNFNLELYILTDTLTLNNNNILSLFEIEDNTNDEDINSWSDFFISILDIPIYYLRSILGFELFGVNLFLAFTSLFTLALGIYVISKLL